MNDNSINKKIIDAFKEEKIIEENNSLLKNIEEAEKLSKAPLNIPENKDEKDVESQKMMVFVDPQTGEHKIIGRASEKQVFNFEGTIKHINESDPDILSTKPFSELEIINYLKSSDDETLLKEIGLDTNISAEALRELLEIVNRKLNKEKFNIYKEAPQEFKDLVDDYIQSGVTKLGIGNNRQMAAARNMISESLLDEFIHNIRADRAKTDFAKELENIYEDGTFSGDNRAEFVEAKNKSYRETANKIKDPEKRERMNRILDAIDEATNLDKLKEFCKSCRIKKIEIEKAENRVFASFLAKYQDSPNNIYGISIAFPVVQRILEKEDISINCVKMLFIAFCKQCSKYSPDNILEHAYMYYFLYNCAMLDSFKDGVFKNNLIDCINNLKERNNYKG